MPQKILKFLEPPGKPRYNRGGRGKDKELGVRGAEEVFRRSWEENRLVVLIKQPNQSLLPAQK